MKGAYRVLKPEYYPGFAACRDADKYEANQSM